MKKILLFASALAGLFLAASCQQENLEPVAENSQVTFTVEAPAVIQTKAIADGLNVDQLIYEVWITGATANQDDLSGATRLYQATTDMVQDGNRMKANITLDLVNDQNFTVLFWAQKKGIDVYNTDWLNAVTYTNLDAEAYAANDNRLDAFYSKAFVIDGATTTPTVTLRRPFAQVNLCTLNNKEAAQTPSDYNITLYQSKMRLDAVPTVFNVATSAATNYVAMEFAYHDVPSGDDQMITVNGKDYYYAGMNYVFAGANIALTYDIATKLNGSVDANVNNTIANVPLKENHRTNIVGNLLTSKVDYEIVVDAAFDGEYYGPDFVQTPAFDEATKTWTVTNRDELLYIAQQVNTGANYFVGQTVQVVNDIDLQGMAWNPIGNSTSTSFNGMFEGAVVAKSSADYPTISNFVIENGNCSGFFGVLCNGGKVRNLNFSNVTISGERQLGVVAGQLYGNLETPTIENVTVECATITAVPVMAGEVYDNGDKIGGIAGLIGQNAYIKDCTVKNSTFKAYRDMGGIVGCTQNGYPSKLTGNSVDNVQFIVTEFYTPYADNTAAGAWGEIRGGTRKNSADVVEDNKEADAEIATVIEIADGVAAAEFDENGEPVNYQVSNANGLAWVGANVAEEDGFTGKTITLTADIDLFKGYMDDGDPITTAPIGDKAACGENVSFKGTFDGAGHTIKNLYQNGWALNYEWGVYGSLGLFRELEDATVKNVTIDAMEALVEGGDISFIAGSATGTCVFENITVKNSTIGTYNNGCGGIIGWSGAGNYTFKNITLESDVVLGGLWGSFDSSIGGVVGQAEPGATYNFENVTVNCRVDAYNDCTASYDYYNYRMCGMVIGRCQKTTAIDGKNYPDLSQYNMTFNNVVVNYGDWMNYHYCRKKGERAARVEPGYAYGGISADRDHSTDNVHCMEWIPFNQLIGGDQYAVKGLPAVDGITVNYPESYYREFGYKVNGDTYTVLTGAGFKKVATEVLSDASKTVTIELANDIDLAGIEWPAVATKAAFVLNGKGKAIKNLTTTAVEDHGFYSTAMFTSTRKAATIKNLVVENATVTGKGGDNSHGAVLVACNYAALNIEGVTVKNSTVSNCDRSSVIATYLYFTDATVKNCVVEGCTVSSIGTAGALLGMNNSNNFEATGNTVKNTTVSSSEGSNKAGILIGTWQSAGTLTSKDNVVENSKAINAGTETNNEIGRTV